MAESSGPPVGLLANGAAFVDPQFYNLPNFGYGSLQDQMKDASGYYDKSGKWVASGWSSGAGAFAGNNVPKFNGAAGSGPNGTFGGGFANMQPNVGGGLLGASAYSGGFNPFAGRGNGPGGPPGTTPTPPGTGTPPPSSGAVPGQPTPTPGTSPVTTNPLPPGTGGGLPGTTVPPRVRDPASGGGLLSGQPPTNTGPITGKSAPVGVPPYGGANVYNTNTNLTEQQKAWAMSGDPRAAQMLAESMGAWGGQGANGQMTPQTLAYHQAMNTYDQAGAPFNGPNAQYTPADANKATLEFQRSQMGQTADGKPLGGWIGDKSPETIQYLVQSGQAIKGADGRYYSPPDPYYMPGGAGYGTAEAKSLGY